jgi:uncharacterized protein YpmB
MSGFASLWLIIGIARLFFYFGDFLLEGTYTWDVISIFQANNLVHILIYYLYNYTYYYLLITVAILCVIFIWFSLKLKVEFQTISSMMAIGFTVFLVGWTFEAAPIKHLLVPGATSTLVLIGVIIAIAPLVLEFEFFSRTLANLIMISIIGFLGLFFVLNFVFNPPESILFLVLIWFSVILLVFVIIYMIFYVVRSSKAPKETDETLKETLKLFTKRRLTEEEVALYKEKKICLVCKGHVSRLSYICPGCDSLYCVKCSNALSDLENTCWVCETPFDETKEIHITTEADRLLEEDEEIIAEVVGTERKRAPKKSKRD